MSRRKGGWVTCPKCHQLVARLERVGDYRGQAGVEFVKLAEGVRDLGRDEDGRRVLLCDKGHAVSDPRL